MKGIIRENLGDSRYIVGVPLAVQPLADEIEKYTKLYQATIPKITDAFAALAEAREGYAQLLAAVTNAAADYELCRLDFSSTTCIESGQTACLNAYSAAESTCYEIESGVGECDPDCQRERARCIAAAARVRDACLAKVAIDCAELEYQHIQECQETHAPIIAKAQAEALAMLPAIQEAMKVLQTEQAIQFSLARKLNELEAIAAREYQITCFKAQWDTELAVGTEVEMAKTPNGRHAITGIITAPTPCLHDARVLPSGHLFVNAAIYPGFETWRPTWRVGTVKEIIAPDLKIQFAPANLAGSLGTLYSENPIDCTPPQIYFDGVGPKEAEADIVTARNALKDAQQALLDAVKIQNDCIAEFDQAWMDQCYGTAVEICDQTYSASIEPALQDRATCYADGPANCEESVAAGLEACEAAFRPAIEEKQGLVDAAQLVVTETAQELVDAQQALADIEAEIQVCVDAINTQEWLDARMVELTAGCKNETDSGYDFCITNGGTPEDCDAVRDAQFADCVQLMADEVLLVNQADAMAQCRDERQADLDAAENAIDAAYYPAMQAELLLGQAEDALEAAEKDLADCNKNWDLAECIASAMAVCDDTYAQATDLFTLQKAACYEEAMRVCDEQRDAAIQACRDDNAQAIEAAQIVVDDAVRDVELATNGRYHPADPLILNVPVAHCRPESYFVGDEVLVDFPVAEGVPVEAMTYWSARRVIGWASNTRLCAIETFIINYFINYPQCIVSGILEQEVLEGEDGTPVEVTHVFDYQSSYWKQMTNEYLQFINVESYYIDDLLFYGWSDGSHGLSHQAVNVQISKGYYSYIWKTPQKIYFRPLCDRYLGEYNYAEECDTVYLQPYIRCFPAGEILPWFEETGRPSTTDAEDNPYTENDFVSVVGWGTWNILGENGFSDLVIAKIPWPDGWENDEDGWDLPGWDDSGKTFGAFSEAPDQVVLWGPLFRIPWNVRSGTFPCCVFAKTGTITDVHNQLYHEYSRTSFGGSVYDYI